MRIFALVVSIVFLLFALVQVNDPDPLLWIFLYLVVAAVSVLVFLRIQYIYIWGLLAIIYFIACLFLFPYSIDKWVSAEQSQSSFNMQMPMIEEAREALGLLISSIIFSIYFIYGRFIKK